MKKLHRSRKSRVIGGICGGVGEFLEVDPTVVRLIWAILAFTGWGLLAYFLAWLIVPEESAP